MKDDRKMIWLIVGLVAILVLAGVGYVGWRSWSPSTEIVDLGAMPEARLNRFLGLGRYLETRYDCYVEHVYEIDYESYGGYDLIIAPLEALPVHGDRWHELTSLLYEDGIVITGLTDFNPAGELPDQYASETVLAYVGIQDLGVDRDRGSILYDGTSEAGEYQFMSYFNPVFFDAQEERPWTAAANVRTLHCLEILNNEALATLDHVLIFEHLAEPVGLGAHSEVLIVHGRNVPSIWGWLLTQARLPLALTALIVIMVIWHFMPRFGPIEPEMARGSRELREHFTASARFLTRFGMSYWLVKPLRGGIVDELRRRAARGAGDADLARMGAQLTGLPEDDVLEALFSSEIKKGSLTKTAAILQQLRERL